MTSPEVTVVIPTRDRAAMLPSALASALGQEDVELELIVVDDGSRDETASLLAGLVEPRLRVIRHEHSTGVARARNAAIAAARGEWLAFLDDDDLWAPRKLRRQLEAGRAEAASFVHGAAVVIDERRRILLVSPACPSASVARQLLLHNAIPGGCSNAIARTELVRRVGGFDQRLSHMADWDLWIRLARAGRPGACPDVVVAHLRHQGNMLARGDHDLISEFKYIADKHRSASEEAGVSFDRARVYRYFARGDRRAGRHRRAARTYLALAVAERSASDLARATAALLGQRPAALYARIRRGRRRRPAPPVPRLPWLEHERG